MNCCNNHCKQGRECPNKEPRNIIGAMIVFSVLFAALAFLSWVENTGAF